MVIYQTRVQRHQKQKKDLSLKVNKKTIVPMVSAGMVLAPAAIAILPAEQAEASEIQAQQTGISAESFIEQIGYSAAEVANANDLYASVMIAQALLESGNGNSGLAAAPYYNLFGVKGSYNGQTVYMPTQEYLNGQWVTIDEPFRQYNSYWESFQDHADVLRSTSFSGGVAHYAGTWKSNTNSYLDATAYLTGRYATDPTYNSKLNWLIQAYNLTRFDTPASGYATSYTNTSYSDTNTDTTEMSYQNTSTQTTGTTETATTSGTTYTVVSGDTLWDIAANYGTTVDQIMANNGLTSDLIMVGQQLAV